MIIEPVFIYQVPGQDAKYFIPGIDPPIDTSQWYNKYPKQFIVDIHTQFPGEVLISFITYDQSTSCLHPGFFAETAVIHS